MNLTYTQQWGTEDRGFFAPFQPFLACLISPVYTFSSPRLLDDVVIPFLLLSYGFTPQYDSVYNYPNVFALVQAVSSLRSYMTGLFAEYSWYEQDRGGLLLTTGGALNM